jgi:hypothetical protein
LNYAWLELGLSQVGAVWKGHTSDAIGRDVGTATSRVDPRVATVADDVHFVDRIIGTGTGGRPVDNALRLEIALQGTIAPHADTWGHVIDMVLNMSRNVVFLASDILMSARTMLPDVEISDKEVFGLLNWCVELDPLKYGLVHHMWIFERCKGRYIASGCLVLACLLADWLMRLWAIPELMSQSITESTLDWVGAKSSVTSSEVICFPKKGDPGVELQ